MDGNQPEIVKALRKIGASVQLLHTVGQGCPDLLAALAGRNVLFEVKDPAQPPSKRKLTDDEAVWFGNWKGEAHVIETAEQAIAILMGE